MRKFKQFLPCLLVFFSVTAAFGAQLPDGFQKAQVKEVISEVENISSRCRTVDELGSRTVEQGKRILSMGASAVYALSNCLGNPDWKVRFWIADMLGYLENTDAQRPLLRLINDPSEKKAVKEQAVRSLIRLDVPLEHEARTRAE